MLKRERNFLVMIGGGNSAQCVGGEFPATSKTLLSLWSCKGWDSPLEASSVRAGHSGPSGLNRGHSMSGRHILRRGRGRETGWGDESWSPLPNGLPHETEDRGAFPILPSSACWGREASEGVDILSQKWDRDLEL